MSLSPIGLPPTVIPEPRPAAPAQRPTTPAAASRSGASAESRSLWELLTPGEREFFARLEALGPLTYRPGSARAPADAAPTGQRIDVEG